MALRIGSSGWVNDLRALSAPLGKDFWAGFRPCSAADLRRLEGAIERPLPQDFVEFYRMIGCGQFRQGGELYSPDDIIQCIGAPVYFVLGSMLPEAEWCSEEEHRRLWLTRGVENPAPDRFTDGALTLAGIKLYDLLQVGSNGCCCYHQLLLAPAPKPFGYCMLTDSQTMEDVSDSFSSGLEKMIAFYAADETA